MAGSRFEYVRSFEVPDALPPDVYIVVRVDGRGFKRFCDEHCFKKPTDARGLALMNAAAADVMREWGDVVLAFGHSDEFSFVLPPRATIFSRRAAKLATGIVSLFSAAYVFHWSRFFPTLTLRRPPAFDARAVAYPRLRHVADYFKWRQVDAHVNALYNEAFWALVQRRGDTPAAAHSALKGTLADAKHALLFDLGINYARLPEMFRRGATLARGLAPRAAAGVGAGVGVEGAAVGVQGAAVAEADGAVTMAERELGEGAQAQSESDFCSGGGFSVRIEDLALPKSVTLCHPDFNAGGVGGAG